MATLWERNYVVYGIRKLGTTARRAGHDIGRDQTGGLMRAGIEGATRTNRVKTTLSDPMFARHPDLVKRESTVTAPSRLWATDLTFVPSRAGGDSELLIYVVRNASMSEVVVSLRA